MPAELIAAFWRDGSRGLQSLNAERCFQQTEGRTRLQPLRRPHGDDRVMRAVGICDGAETGEPKKTHSERVSKPVQHGGPNETVRFKPEQTLFLN